MSLEFVLFKVYQVGDEIRDLIKTNSGGNLSWSKTSSPLPSNFSKYFRRKCAQMFIVFLEFLICPKKFPNCVFLFFLTDEF